jgi:hypothetical protein
MDGWVSNSMDVDYGEDFLVDIWREDKGVSTGCSFKCQLKSTSNWHKHVHSRHPEQLKYPLKTKDLKHWHEAHIPVVVVIWDVKERLGYWQDVPTIIEELSATKPHWWRQDKVPVAIPLRN